MRTRHLFSAVLVICLLTAVLSPVVSADDSPALGDFIERYAPLLDDGFSSLTDWLNDRTATLAPELSDTLNDIDTQNLLSDLRALVGETSGMSDGDLREAIISLSEAHGIHLVDSQVQQLMDLCRTLEKLSPEALKEKTDALHSALPHASGLRGVLDKVLSAFRGAAHWLGKTFSGLFR